MNAFAFSLEAFAREGHIALRALGRNKLRAGLTALGVIIGVASVVAMVAVGEGARAGITAKVSSLGENLLVVYAGARRDGGVSAGSGSAASLTPGDAEAILREVDGVAAASPETMFAAQASANGRNWATTVVGESESYPEIRNWELAAGAWFTSGDVRAQAKVAVLGPKTARELFGAADPVGRAVRLGRVPFTVIGVLAEKGSGMVGQNQDDRILIPYTTAMRRLTGERYLRVINISLRDASATNPAREAVARLLRRRHGLGHDAADDFEIFSQKDIADTVGAITGMVTLLLGAISGLSLLVGGVGIMNIMLVSVTERTREIGIRLAVGATPSAIRRQFLVEAIFLSLLGGGVGVLLGSAGAALIGSVSTFRPVVTGDSVLIAFGVSFAVGVIFGFYPARKASAMNPIDALRFE